LADRFDKFSERARRSLTFSLEEATRLNHNYIGPEHILLGLVREGDGIAAKTLASHGILMNNARSGIEFLIGRGHVASLGEIGLTSSAKKIIELAVEQAQKLGHRVIGTEHLLLGLLDLTEDNVAVMVVSQLGVDFDKMRSEVIAQLDVFYNTPLTGLTEEQRSTIHQAVADSLAALERFEIDKENPVRLEFETIAAEMTQTIVDEIKREPGWLGFLHFLVVMVGEESRIDELWYPGTTQAKWFRFISDNIWAPLFREFSGLDHEEMEKAQEAIETMADLLADLKRMKK